jgi:hypothetical protein
MNVKLKDSTLKMEAVVFLQNSTYIYHAAFQKTITISETSPGINGNLLKT